MLDAMSFQRSGSADLPGRVPAELDVLIVGAGLSGIAAAVHLKKRCPDKRWLILESRGNLGGTWDLFRYPGVRSDSDMYTLGFSFKPWTGGKAIAGGETILRYLEEAAREHGIDRQIRFDHRVIRASWASERVAWLVEAEQHAQQGTLAATAAAHNGDELPGRDMQIDAAQHPLVAE